MYYHYNINIFFYIPLSLRFFSKTAFDEILTEFEVDLNPMFCKKYLRAIRFIAVLLPTSDLSSDQIARIFALIHPNNKTCQSRPISSQFDIFFTFLIKKLTKGNGELLKSFDWTPFSKFSFENILPSILKIPSPVGGVRKSVTKLIKKVDISMGEYFFESIGKDSVIHVAKWIVYTMTCDQYPTIIHEKLIFFLTSLRNLCHPSNRGPWSQKIEAFLVYMTGALSKKLHDPEFKLQVRESIIDELVEKIWNLSEKLVYSKSGHSNISSFTCNYLCNIRPSFIIPKLIESVSNSLACISEPHRTTAAIGLMHTCTANLLNYSESDLGIAPTLALLPVIVHGIDSNDKLKTINTISFFLTFSEEASVKDISCEQVCSVNWSDKCQEAKELTGQFLDSFLLFTEKVISYLSSTSSTECHLGKSEDDISGLILTITNIVYSQLSIEIVKICMEKWIEFFMERDSSCSSNRTVEVTAQIISNIGKTFPKLKAFDRLIPGVIEVIRREITEKGAGQRGSKDQSNSLLNRNLVFLGLLLEESTDFVLENDEMLKSFSLFLLENVTNKNVFIKCNGIFFSMAISLVRPQIQEAEKDNCGDVDSHPFSEWGKWVKPENMKTDIDFNWIIPDETQVIIALEILETSITWIEGRISSEALKNADDFFGLLNTIDNIMICLFIVYNAYSQINSKIFYYETVSRRALSNLELLLKIVVNLHPLIEKIENLDLNVKYIQHVRSWITGYPVNPDHSREKLKSLKRISVNRDRYYREKERPLQYWIKLAETQLKFRRDSLKIYLGDDNFDSAMMSISDTLADILYSYAFKKHHMIRSAAQTTLQSYACQKYPEKAESFVQKILERIELTEDLTDDEFKGIAFTLQGGFIDTITEDFTLVNRYYRALIRINGMDVSKRVNNSFEILNSTLSSFISSFVPFVKAEDMSSLDELIKFLITTAVQSDENWTVQYLALVSLFSILELYEENSEYDNLSESLIKLTLSKVDSIRNLAQNCLKVVIFKMAKNRNENYLLRKHLSGSDFYAQKALAPFNPLNNRRTALRTWKEGEFSQFTKKLIDEYFDWLVLSDDHEIEFEYQNFATFGRIVSLLGPEELNLLLDVSIIPRFMTSTLDIGRKRALVEITTAILCNFEFTSQAEECKIWLKMKDLVWKSWMTTGIELVGLWSEGIDEPLLWTEPLINEIFLLYEKSVKANDSTKIILSLKMIQVIYGQVSDLMFKTPQSKVEFVKSIIEDLFSHEYSSIGMESSTLLALISSNDHNHNRSDIVNVLNHSLSHGNDIKNSNFIRSVYKFILTSSSIPELTNFWNNFLILLPNLMEYSLISEDVQLVIDTKKVILQLFLTRNCSFGNLTALTEILLNFIKNTILSAKIIKFCVELIQILVQNNFAIFNEKQFVTRFFDEFVDKLVNSGQMEIREASLGIVMTLYQIDPIKGREDSEEVVKVLESHEMINCIKSEQNVQKRHSAVILASAIILSEPYVITKHLPAVLSALSIYISDRSPMSQLTRSTFNEFRRTHQGTWTEYRDLFTEEQLDAIGELLIAPSYYA